MEGNKATIIDDKGLEVTGKIAKVMTYHNDKKGCMVELEGEIKGRVIKVHKKAYCLEFKDGQDDGK
ncbi:MAG: hypothetical protein E7256_05975 [Lachnospiraceae bacterium]|nr:hypothetical protein [Lachnospiraceae bacterium]